MVRCSGYPFPRLILLMVIFSAPAAAQTAADSAAAITKSPSGAMMRSLVLPGGGQFYNDKWLKGLAIAAAEIGCIANAVVQNQYAVREEIPYYREIYRDRRNLSFWWLAGIILYSMADAYVDAHLYNFDESESIAFNLGMNSSEMRYTARLQFRF
ncbi:hypothetical protein JW992_09465 [candidate division KSB1 bacterium]|nr:hypothetical protein [candidate division KSB1 bacterium]